MPTEKNILELANKTFEYLKHLKNNNDDASNSALSSLENELCPVLEEIEDTTSFSENAKNDIRQLKAIVNAKQCKEESSQALENAKQEVEEKKINFERKKETLDQAREKKDEYVRKIKILILDLNKPFNEKIEKQKSTLLDYDRLMESEKKCIEYKENKREIEKKIKAAKEEVRDLSARPIPTEKDDLPIEGAVATPEQIKMSLDNLRTISLEFKNKVDALNEEEKIVKDLKSRIYGKKSSDSKKTYENKNENHETKKTDIQTWLNKNRVELPKITGNDKVIDDLNDLIEKCESSNFDLAYDKEKLKNLSDQLELLKQSLSEINFSLSSFNKAKGSYDNKMRSFICAKRKKSEADIVYKTAIDNFKNNLQTRSIPDDLFSGDNDFDKGLDEFREALNNMKAVFQGEAEKLTDRVEFIENSANDLIEKYNKNLSKINQCYKLGWYAEKAQYTEVSNERSALIDKLNSLVSLTTQKNQDLIKSAKGYKHLCKLKQLLTWLAPLILPVVGLGYTAYRLFKDNRSRQIEKKFAQTSATTQALKRSIKSGLSVC